MSVRDTVTRQYQAIVDRAASQFGAGQPPLPPEGWIATARKALGMSGAQLAKRLGVTRARVSQAERAEPSGSITLKTMRATAEAMGCRFVYAIVPEDRIEDVIAAQARKKAIWPLKASPCPKRKIERRSSASPGTSSAQCRPTCG